MQIGTPRNILEHPRPGLPVLHSSLRLPCTGPVGKHPGNEVNQISVQILAYSSLIDT